MKRTAFILLILILVQSCAIRKKLDNLGRMSIASSLELSDDLSLPDTPFEQKVKDTILVTDFEGKEVMIMKAIRDEDGEMVATDVLDAALVTARFRNIAERHGKVDLRFRIVVPPEMMDSKWQLRFFPRIRIFDQEEEMEPVYITGKGYRKTQLRGYQQYEKFLESIITDSTRFLNRKELEVFLKRNLPELFSLKTDTTFVSDEYVRSIYGVDEKEAVAHYTNQLKLYHNNRKISRLDKVYAKCVKAPIVSEGIRLDTVLVSQSGAFIYEYVQTINTRPRLKKAEIILAGNIFEQERKIYDMPQVDPLTFYISSLSSFVDPAERFITNLLERRVEANTACYVEFAAGKDEVDETIGENFQEIGRIKSNLASLVENEQFDMDSVVVTASCSPEGKYAFNEKLSEARGASVGRFFKKYLESYADSLAVQGGFSVDLDGNVSRSQPVKGDISFLTKTNAENWKMLDVLVRNDTILNSMEKEIYSKVSEVEDLDEREKCLQSVPFYKYMRESLYPRLRTVKFDFYLHRKGMVKDTVYTTVIDSVYMRGVQALKDSDYELAITLLQPYADFNTAIAYCAMDYNASALSILENMEKDAKVNYMLAILYSRKGEEEAAVRCYVDACRENSSYVHRGNLDPEILTLINKYQLGRLFDSL